MTHQPITDEMVEQKAIEALKALDAVLDFSTPMKGNHVLIEIDDPSAFNAAAEKARAALEAALSGKEEWHPRDN